FHVMKLCNDDRVASVVEAAEKYVDLERIATGAGKELALGPGYEHHSCLDMVLQELRRFPGHGASLIQAGLKSPGIRNRNMAVWALAGWGRDKWPGDVHEALKAAVEVEPDDDVRVRMEKALKGEPLDN